MVIDDRLKQTDERGPFADRTGSIEGADGIEQSEDAPAKVIAAQYERRSRPAWRVGLDARVGFLRSLSAAAESCGRLRMGRW